ncbi:MAG TPA: hypothetical protein GX401_07900 [Clostridiales bacterium]|nr:hypothetical protein [Clostridiales bacterium]
MTQGAVNGLLFCSNVLIPSLFPFMVLSSFIVKSNLSDSLSTLFKPITKYCFNLPTCCGITILLSVIGGYPVGAKGTVALWKQGKITEAQAKFMVLFAVGSGPAFVVFVVGENLLHSTQVGIILCLSQVLAQIIIGVVMSLFHREKLVQYGCTHSHPIEITNALVSSCSDSVMSMLNLCGLVVIFSSIMGIIKSTGADQWLSKAISATGIGSSTADSILPALWEVTDGCSTAISNNAPISILAFAIGFGGVCVHFQIYSIIGNLPVSKVKFLAIRFCQGVLSALITVIVLSLFPQSENVFSNVSSPTITTGSATYIGSIALVIMSVMFLLTVKPYSKNSSIINK